MQGTPSRSTWRGFTLSHAATSTRVMTVVSVTEATKHYDGESEQQPLRQRGLQGASGKRLQRRNGLLYLRAVPAVVTVDRYSVARITLQRVRIGATYCGTKREVIEPGGCQSLLPASHSLRNYRGAFRVGPFLKSRC